MCNRFSSLHGVAPALCPDGRPIALIGTGNVNIVTRRNRRSCGFSVVEMVGTLAVGATITASQTLEFWPDGTVHALTNGIAGAPLGDPGVTITVSKNAKTKNIMVNGLGKIVMDR